MRAIQRAMEGFINGVAWLALVGVWLEINGCSLRIYPFACFHYDWR